MPIDASVYGAIQPPRFNNPFESLGQIYNLQAMQEQRRASTAATQALEEQRRTQTAAAQQKQFQDTVLAEVYGESFDPQTGSVNRQRLAQGLTTRGLGQLAPDVLKALDEAEKANADAKAAKLKANEAETAYAKTLASQIFAAEFNPAVVKGIFALAKSHDYDIGPYEQLFTEKPDEFKAFVTNLAQPKDAPKPFSLGPGQVQFGADGKEIARVPANPPNPVSVSPGARLVDPQSGRVIAEGAPAREPAGPQSPVAVMGPDGKPVYVRPQEAYGRTPASTREQGRAVISGDANRIADLDTSLDDVNVLRQTIAAPGESGATGTAAKIGAMLPNAITELTGWGASAKSKQATIDRVKQVIGKALEGGVLRKEDEAKYEKILPTIADVDSVVLTKLDGLEKALQLRRQTLLDALSDAGYDTGRFNARTQPVRMMAPNGQVQDVPADQVEHYKAKGAKVVP